MKLISAVLLAGVMASAQNVSHKVVLLDGYHNQETKQPMHYRWEGTDNGGFSILGEMLKGMGAELKTTETTTTPQTLTNVDCLIIVDPDTPAESDHPNYMGREEIEAIVPWVEKGGRLLLLGNDKGNAEFEHFNQLAERFGIHFVEATLGKTSGKAILKLEGKGPIFANGNRFYGVDIAPLQVTRKSSAEVLLEYQNTPAMVLVHQGRGLVFALGDPWIYNEYIHREDNEAIARNLFLMLLGR
jgi:unsaturated rhamnogalacturonyl hydrolase